jgi:NADH dehydrogenase/NADH:ubiquinone oxidoreductase subunit G
MDEIRLKIDGKEVTASKGMTVLEAAQKEGIYIPALCADPDLEPIGACRLCIVEVEGQEEHQLSCMILAEQAWS